MDNTAFKLYIDDTNIGEYLTFDQAIVDAKKAVKNERVRADIYQIKHVVAMTTWEGDP